MVSDRLTPRISEGNSLKILSVLKDYALLGFLLFLCGINVYFGVVGITPFQIQIWRKSTPDMF